MTELPPQSEYRWGRRYREQPVLLLIEVHVRRFFSITWRGHQCVELVVDVMVTLSAGRGQQCCRLADYVIVTFSVGVV